MPPWKFECACGHIWDSISKPFKIPHCPKCGNYTEEKKTTYVVQEKLIWTFTRRIKPRVK